MFPSFSTTGIGSLPLSDAREACRIVFDSVSIPFWPQLPQRSFLEFMIPQFTEGFPFVKINGEHIYVEKGEGGEATSFYEAIEKEAGFPISERYAPGFYVLLDALKQNKKKLPAVKGHITGPLTFTLSLTDAQKRPVYFDEEIRELALYLLKGKAKWQIENLKPFAEKIIIFIDEPILSALGTSTYLGVNAEEALRLLSETVSYIRNSGGVTGIHCCGKADWSMILSSGVDILNFDAYFFWDTLSIYPDAIKEFINKGGFIAWGIVPTISAIKNITLNDLREQLERGLSSLAKIGIPDSKLRNQVILTPACGTGSMDVEGAMKVFSLLKDLRQSYAKD
ncbi:MAG: methionine synthase [Nitrospirae bacterium]|nr:methionine synthase [Nitrospirota bacterium]